MISATKLWYIAYRYPKIRPVIQKAMRLLYSCDVSAPQKMGGNFLEHNGLGVVISKMVIIGSNCRIYQHTTIGAGKGGYPVLGNNVVIYGNTTICGKITIGNNVTIGANSFVNKDIPNNVIVGGCPAKILKYNK